MGGLDLSGPELCFDFSFGPDQRIDSDNEKLKAEVSCESGADCADTRTVITGSTFEVRIDVPSTSDGSEPEVTSTDRLELTGFESEPASCEGAYHLMGTVHFDDAGTAALIVSDSAGEIDRFTVTAYDADHLDMQVARGRYAFPGSGELVPYEDGDTLSIDTVHSLVLSVVNADGERLVGATDLDWEVEDTSIAAIGRGWGVAEIQPRAIGATTLRARGGGLTAELQLEITDVIEWAPDAGVVDGSVAEEVP